MPKLLKIFFYFVPILVMIGLIPVVPSDYILTNIYIIFIIMLLLTKHEKNDIPALLLGIIGVTISEYFFVSTGVEIFTRASLFGLMPLWLPFLWGYAFVTIKRTLRIIESKTNE